MRKLLKLEVAFLLLSVLGVAPPRVFGATDSAPSPGADTLNQVLDGIIRGENDVVRHLEERHPLVETYIQTLAPDADLGTVPKEDHYFLGKLDISESVKPRSLVPSPGMVTRIGHFFGVVFSAHFSFLPDGFAAMLFLDPVSFDREHYDFEFVRREFLGEVRTLVFEVKPKESSGKKKFLGRVWVEDQGFHVVRFNGTYSPWVTKHLHFDSWRVQTGPGLWLPAYVYSEESEYRWGLARHLQYKAQTRIWGYDLSGSPSIDEFTKVMVEAPTARDSSETPDDLSPVGGLRAWERLAEDNVIERMTKGGLLAPEGDVDRVLQTVVNNLEVTNNLDIRPEVRCRVLLSTPLESFTIGHTIVLSRGLIDVLPDEASLAMVLAHELAHIALGHRLDTKYAFSDRMLFADEETFERLGFHRDENEEAQADQRAIEMLKNSPYGAKLAGAGLFLRALDSRAERLRALIRPHLGDRLASERKLLRMAGIVEGAPQLEPARTDQVAALPLGGRIKVDPWSARIELLKNKPVSLLSAREKMPFEVTPILPYLIRKEGGEGATPEVGAAVGRTAAQPPPAVAPEPQTPHE